MGVELAAAAAVFIFVSALFLLLLARPSTARAVERRLGMMNRAAPVQAAIEGSGFLRSGASSLPAFSRMLAKSSWADKATLDLQRAGLALKVSEYFLLRGLLAVLVGFLVLLLTHGSGIGFFLTIGAAVVGFMIPSWYVAHLRSRRINTINGQLVETLQLISNSLRSGFAFTQAVEMAAKQMQPPIQDELTRFIQENALGAKTDEALEAMADRTGSYDVEMMVTTIVVQRTTGGNLSEILDIVAETIRERERLQGEIKALTASQRLTGLVLSVYPLGLGLLFVIVAPSLMKVLWQDPAGRILLVTALILQGLGILAINRILRLDV